MREMLETLKQIRAIVHNGLSFSHNNFDLDRYEQIKTHTNDLISKITNLKSEEIESFYIEEKSYITPKTDVRAVVINNGKILMVKELADGKWSLPGGWADVGYSPAEIAVKEVSEESGYEVAPKRLLAVLDRSKHNHPPSMFYSYKIFIECTLIGGNAETSMETSAVNFFGFDKLPDLSLARVTPQEIEMMYQLVHAENPIPFID